MYLLRSPYLAANEPAVSTSIGHYSTPSTPHGRLMLNWLETVEFQRGHCRSAKVCISPLKLLQVIDQLEIHPALTSIFIAASVNDRFSFMTEKSSSRSRS